MKNKIRKFLLKNSYGIGSFLLPSLILIVVLAIIGIFPFGDRQLPIIDMYHQYVPFLSELQYKLHGGGSLFYTWNGGGGSNFWCLMAYYGASPVNLLLILFPQGLICEAITLILLVKVGLTGSFMYKYLVEVVNMGYNRNNHCASWHTVAFSTLYALSSYILGYYWCIMWLDAVMLLPLCIIGLNRIIEGRGFKLYVVSLALTIFINYYIASMICIFILIYYPLLYFMKIRKFKLIHCVRTTGKAVGASLLAICLSAVMLLPTYFSMKNAYYMDSSKPGEHLLYYDPISILNQLLPEAHLTFRTGLPNLYCGMLVVIMLVFYYMSKRIGLREKVLNSVLLGILFMSINYNWLDYIWHGFHFPNELPHRFSFLVCFLLVGMSYKAFIEINEVSCRQISFLLAFGMAYYFIAQKLLKDTLDNPNVFFYFGVALLVVYCGILYSYRKGIIKRREMTIMLVTVVCAELICSGGFSIDKSGTTDREEYLKNVSNMRSLEKRIDSEFVRTELDSGYILNAPAMLHYKGLSQFSSSLNANATELMENIGLEGTPAKNRFNYNQTNPVTNAMLGVKYIITRDGKLKDPDFNYVVKSGNSRLYENVRPLSIGYMASDYMRLWTADSYNPFDNLNQYVEYMTADKYQTVFQEVKYSDISAENISVEDDGGGNLVAIQDDASVAGTARIEYKADRSTKYYAFVEASGAETITIERKDSVYNVDVRNDSGSILNLGTVEKGENFTVNIQYKTGGSGSIEAHICTLDEKKWDKAYEMISENPWKVTEFSSRKIKAAVTATKDKNVLITSIPYEEGWTLKVDGKKRDITELTGGLWISAELKEGSHEVELSFMPPHFKLGLLISLISLFVLISISPLAVILRHLRPEEECDCNRIEPTDEQ